MKHEWKKHERDLYGTKEVPCLITVPKQNYIMLNGKGNPNDTDFSEKVGALYSLAYAIKMGYKNAPPTKDSMTTSITDYTVYPLEGIWQQKKGHTLVKETLEYTIMIRQPDFITTEMVYIALEKTKKKKPTHLLDEILFNTREDGQCVEILHIGSYDDEPASFAKMNEFAKQNNLERAENCHREIYLSNAKRVLKSKIVYKKIKNECTPC